MLHKTKGIVLNFVKYKETSIIVKIYTEAFGLTSYIVNGVRSGKGKHRIALYQPLTLLELVVYENKRTKIQRISEVKCSEPFISIPTDIKKTSIAIFLTEILIKSLKGEEENQPLFSFLYQSILILEHLPDRYENFHLQFLLKYSRYLGFPPSSGEEIDHELTSTGHKLHQKPEDLELLDFLIENKFENNLVLSNFQRQNILKDLVNFYHLHIENLGQVKSLTVLNEVLR